MIINYAQLASESIVKEIIIMHLAMFWFQLYAHDRASSLSGILHEREEKKHLQ
jgi:hypothetical protein